MKSRLRFISCLFFLFCISASAQKWKPILAEFDSLVILCENTRNNLQVPEAHRDWLKQMHLLAETQKSNPMRWRTLYFESWFAGRVNDYGKEAKLLDEALTIVDSVNYEYDYRRILWNRRIIGNWGHLVDSYRLIRQDMQYYQKIGDDLMVGVMYLNMARIFDQLHMYEKEEECMRLAEERYRKIGFTGAIERYVPEKISLYFEMGNLDKAKALYRKALKSRYILEDTVSYFTLLTSGYYTQIDPEASLRAYRLAAEYGKMPALTLISKVNHAAYLLDNGNCYEAIVHFRDALAQAIRVEGHIQETDIKLAVYSGLHHAYAAVQRFDSAYWFANLHSMMRDSLEALNNKDQFLADIESQMIQQEEAKFDIERQQAKVRLTILCLIAALLILAAGAFAWWHRIRSRIKEVENDRLAAKVEKEKLERQLYQQQCENRERELTTNSLLLIEKKKMIETLNRQIEECGAEGKIDRDAKRRLLGFIKIHENTEESLQQFYDYFNQVHPDFFQSLKNAFPALTQGELRLCAYIRMGLDNKQIAQIMSIQGEGIKKARYRLRKKLCLQTGASLEDFLLLWPGRKE